MRVGLRFAGVALLAGAALAGCHKAAESFGSLAGGRGRYAGIGIYAPGKAWQDMVAAQPKTETQGARTVDDEAIIVVVDSATGEVRSCGDVTGYCIGMNPWKTPLAAAQMAPVNLTSHAKSIDEESVAATSDAPAKPR